MKTVFTILLVLMTFISRSGGNRDSLMMAGLKPSLQSYINQVDVISQKISQTKQRDSIRFFAKQLMRLSDEMEKDILYEYNYRSPETLPIMLFSATGVSFAYVNIPGDRSPRPRGIVNSIYDQASFIRFLNVRNVYKRNKNLAEIKTLNAKLLSL